jgi:F-type H+-transporting ATPase subunit b
MKIDWFTVIAQVINFLLLVWLLKRFLYKPILQAVDEREKSIAAQLQDAEQKKAVAEQEQQEFSKKNAEFDRQKKSITDQVIADSKAERQRLFDEARQDAQQLRDRLNAASRTNLETISDEIIQRTQDEVFAISKKLLTDLSTLTLEEQIIHVFIDRLQAMTEEEKNSFLQTVTSGASPILIESAFPMTDKQQAAIRQALTALSGSDLSCTFSTDPGVIGGIELRVNGFKLAWSIAEYLKSLRNTLADFAKENFQTTSGTVLSEKKSTASDGQSPPDAPVKSSLNAEPDQH